MIIHKISINEQDGVVDFGILGFWYLCKRAEDKYFRFDQIIRKYIAYKKLIAIGSDGVTGQKSRKEIITSITFLATEKNFQELTSDLARENIDFRTGF